MGLLDSILGAALGGNNQQGGDQNIALQLIMSLIQQNGGVSGLLGKNTIARSEITANGTAIRNECEMPFA